MSFLWGLTGVIVILGLAYLMSSDRKNIRLRTVLGALGIQVLFAYLALKSSVGRQVMQWISDAFQQVVKYANEGIVFLFGSLVAGEESIFALEVLTIIIFFSSLISVLYYLGVMQWFVDIVGGGLSKLLNTTKTESLSAAANIFLGHTEAPLIIKPYIKSMSDSEVFAVMVGGMGSVAGSVLVGYSLMGIPLEYLLAASFMSAPASLLMAKIVMPLPEEVMKQQLSGELDAEIDKEALEGDAPVNIIDAASSGAATGLKMALNVAAMLLAFVSLVAMLNGFLEFIGGFFGWENANLEGILGILLTPIAFLIGVPWEEAIQAAGFIGEKLVINEFYAFANVGAAMDQLSDKTIMILSFGLAGFANIGAVAAQIGGIGALAPNKKNFIAQTGIKAMVVGAMVSLLNAAIAGMFF
ncbi:NupC/NupG family nucleoside CNT transporter [Atopococcus tabaci]|uniref:NupC/NupG family nucleoside CNT transporter n=1 Tax=Atopococcus tabaci TaxID=269774 RepID=UPI002409384C|nr:NupC/NupG family nucleoside CNT transporter [Atopococcus tabaci]